MNDSPDNMRTISVILSFTLFSILISCGEKQQEQVGENLLLSLGFDSKTELGSGALPIKNTKGVIGKGLDLEAVKEGIVLEELGTQWFSVNKDFSVSVWVKSESSSVDTTLVLSNGDFSKQDMGIYGKRRTNKGFAIFSVNGAWGWNIGNGGLHYNYEPIAANQPVADGQWHQIVFVYKTDLKEARLYYDGVNKATLSLGDLKKRDFSAGMPLVIGKSEAAPDYKSFQGTLDELKVWQSALSDEEVKKLYRQYAKPTIEPSFDKEVLTVLNWNIWHGGTHYTQERDGFDGVERIVEMIEKSGADVVLMQETYGAGSKISSSLDFYYYEASSTIGAVWGANLSVMSRYPIEEVYMLEEPSNYGKNYAFNNGGAKIRLSENKAIIAFSNWYNGRKPEDLEGALKGWKALLDGSGEIPIVWGGDFNSISHLDDGLGESGHSKLMTNAGFKDSYREIYPDPSRYPSYTAPRYEDRIDYVYYLGGKLQLIEAGKIVEDFRGRDKTPGYPSDHLGITANFKIH